ncbi:MAG: hypothetical protein LBS11_11835 [Oscillospiraceae bacterium]|jgi:hypothetical protein|nr:hypothetical protein [Oscillospiraceae bacterium]
MSLTNRTRVVIWVLVLSVALSIAVPAAFVLVRADHIHDRKGADDGCAMCAAVQNALDMIKSLAALCLSLSLVVCGFLSGAPRSCLNAPRYGYSSPVMLRVRLNN